MWSEKWLFFFFFASYCSAFRYFFLLGTFSQHLFFPPLPVIFPSLLLLELLFLEKPNQEGNTGFSGCSAPIQLRYGMWDFPRPGIKPMSPTLQPSSVASEAPGKPFKGNGLSGSNRQTILALQYQHQIGLQAQLPCDRSYTKPIWIWGMCSHDLCRDCPHACA